VRAWLESTHNINRDPTIEVPVPSEQIPTLLPPGRVLVILNPADQESLTVLQTAIPRHVVLERDDYEGKAAFLMFIGER
jgi:hypothetical protein